MTQEESQARCMAMGEAAKANYQLIMDMLETLRRSFPEGVMLSLIARDTLNKQGFSVAAVSHDDLEEVGMALVVPNALRRQAEQLAADQKGFAA